MKKVNWPELLIKGTEWFSRLAVLNLLWLLFSLPIFTLIPATFTLFAILKRWTEGELDQSTFSLFKEIFFSSFKRSFRIGLPFLVVGFILIVNLIFFFTTINSSPWFSILKNANLLLALLYIYLLFYSLALSQFTEWKNTKIISTAFLLMLSQPRYTLMAAGSILLLIFIFDFFPALFFFFSGSVIGLIFVKATQQGYSKLVRKAHVARSKN